MINVFHESKYWFNKSWSKEKLQICIKTPWNSILSLSEGKIVFKSFTANFTEAELPRWMQRASYRFGDATRWHFFYHHIAKLVILFETIELWRCRKIQLQVETPLMNIYESFYCLWTKRKKKHIQKFINPLCGWKRKSNYIIMMPDTQLSRDQQWLPPSWILLPSHLLSRTQHCHFTPQRAARPN
jgi:hypothetical protein